MLIYLEISFLSLHGCIRGILWRWALIRGVTVCLSVNRFATYLSMIFAGPYLFRFLVLSVFLFIIAIMTDVAVDMSGQLSAPVAVEKISSGFSGFPKSLPKIPSFSQFVASCRESIKPWSEFVNTSNFKTPPTFARLLKRAVNNVKYFQGNYIVITVILMAYCLLTSPLLLLSVIASCVGCYILSLKEKRPKINGKEITLNQQYGLVGLFSLPLYYWAGVGQAVFWVIGASCFVVSLHAGFYSIENILKEEDQLEVLLQV